MQSNGARILVGLGSVVAIVVLLIVFAGGSDDDAETTALLTTTTTTGDGGDGSGGNGSEKPPEPPKPPEPETETIVIEGGQPVGGVADLKYTKGDEVRIDVKSDVAEHVHVHGYDLFYDVEAGGKVKVRFDASIDGVFEIELEDSAVQIVQLTVKP